MSMTKRIAIAFDMKAVIPESDIVAVVAGSRKAASVTPVAGKEPLVEHIRQMVAMIDLAETEEDKRIQIERLVEFGIKVSFREWFENAMAKELSNLGKCSPLSVKFS